MQLAAAVQPPKKQLFDRDAAEHLLIVDLRAEPPFQAARQPVVCHHGHLLTLHVEE